MSRYYSIILCAATGILLAIGLTMLTSTSAWVRGVENPYHFIDRQVVMTVIGLILAIFAARFPLEKVRKLAPWMFVATCFMLVLCYIPGVGVTIYGSKRWIYLPGVGQFQPSELSKIVIVICLSAWFARWQTEVKTFWRGFIIPGIIGGIPIALIAAETDVGAALSISAAIGAILYCVGTRLVFIGPTAVSVISFAAYFVRHNVNRWTRIEAWLHLDDPASQLDKGMQQWRALLALGNGGPWGVGLGNGVEKFGTLTFAHIDFIFPVLGEELGLPCTLGVIFCFVLIAICGCGIALKADNLFNRCVALGITCVIVVPAMQNIAVTTAMLPNDGLPLPFVSFGGTSLVFSMVAIGMLVGIDRRSQAKVREEFPLTNRTRLAVRL
jgi:cell division protein FtsW